MNRVDAFARIESVQTEFDAARVSIERTLSLARKDPAALDRDKVKPSDLTKCQKNLDVTYTARLFVEFEAILRDFYWSVIHPHRSPRRTDVSILIDRIAARRYVPDGVRQDAHAVREYRNDVIHDGLRTPRLSLDDCRSRLARFFAHFPPNW